TTVSGYTSWRTHDKADVLAAEAERVRYGVHHLYVAGAVGDAIQRQRRIGRLVVDGGRQPAVLHREQREDRFHGAGGGQRVADHRLVGRDRDRRSAVAEHGGHTHPFHLVILRRASAVRVDVADRIRRQPGIIDRLLQAVDDRLAVR